MAVHQATGNGSDSRTLAVVQRFIEAFQQKDARAVADLVAEDCVMEAMQPAPDGERVEGYAANVRFWEAMVADPIGSFEVEDLIVCREWAINRWRYRFGAGHEDSVRGVTLIRVRDGKIAEALGYAKTPPRTTLGQTRAESDVG
jgi:ketosteroid isomerase-like protein